jgi:hypothetical protein
MLYDHLFCLHLACTRIATSQSAYDRIDDMITISLQLGKILKLCFMNNKVYVFYTTDKPTYEEVFTKKHEVTKEISVTENSFNAVSKLIDIL